MRIIKPDGTINEVSTDEYMTATEGINDKEHRQKLAVPGLEIGDKIDIFFFNYTSLENHNLDPFIFRYVVDDYVMQQLNDFMTERGLVDVFLREGIVPPNSLLLVIFSLNNKRLSKIENIGAKFTINPAVPALVKLSP